MDILGQVGMLPPDQILESEDDEEQAASDEEEVRATERIVGLETTLGLNKVFCLNYELKRSLNDHSCLFQATAKPKKSVNAMADSDEDDEHQDSEKKSEGDAEVLPRTSKANAASSDEDDEVGKVKS